MSKSSEALLKTAARVVKKLKSDDEKAALLLIATAAKLEKTHTNIEKEIAEIKINSKSHSDEDNGNFKNIHDKIDVANKKFEEVLLVLENQNKYADDFRKQVTPMLEVFTNNKITSATLGKRGEIVLKGASAVAVLYGAWHIIIQFIQGK